MNPDERASRRRNIFVVCYLAIQLTLPIDGFVRGKMDTRGDFSWNMYSQHYGCDVRYVLLTPDGKGLLVDNKKYSRRPDRINTVFRRDWLPIFNDWLCAELQREGKSGELKARITCRHNHGPMLDLVEPYSRVCSISARGVRQP